MRELSLLGKSSSAARREADARVSRIYAGSNEIMKEIVGRAMVA